MIASTRSVLIIGGSGFLGTHLALSLREGYKVFATYHSHRLAIPGVTFLPLKLEDRNWVKQVCYLSRPDVIIYAAGKPDVDWAEANARDAERIHTGGAVAVAGAADILQHKFIYLSSCYLFDGARGNYRETDTILPSTAYGKAMLGGENFIRGKSLNYLVVRSSPVFGRGNGLNLPFLDRLRMALDRGQRVELPADELHSFGSVHGLVELVARLIDTGVKNRVLHYGGLTKVTWHELGQALARRMGHDPTLVVPRQAQHQRRSSASDATMRDYSLNSSQACELLKIKPLLLEQGLDLIQKKLVPGA